MKILDCTLRDGGYYTDWNFPTSIVETYLKTVSKLPISFVELGYLSNEKDNNGPFYHLTAKTLLFAKKILNKKQKIFAMVNSKEISNSRQLISLLLKVNKNLDGVRFAVDPKKVKNFLKIILPVKKKFPKIQFCINLMYFSKWHQDIKFVKEILKELEGKVDIVSIVDSYGSILPNEIENFFRKIDIKKLVLGCHLHNNCGLALSNTLSAINKGCVIADSTFLGMGRGAGNAETELLLALKSPTNSKLSGFEINNLIEKLEPMKSRMKWGSSFSYAFAAREGYSQSKMMDLIQKRRLDPSIAVKALVNSDENLNRIRFKNINHLKKLKKTTPILLGGGNNLIKYGSMLIHHLDENIPLIFSGSKALNNYEKMNIKIKNPAIILLSGNELKKINIENKKILNKINISAIIAEESFINNKQDLSNKKVVYSNSVAINPLLLAGLALLNLKKKELNLAFFDGDFGSEKGKIVMKETQESVNYLRSKGLKISSLTSTFLEVKTVNPFIYD